MVPGGHNRPDLVATYPPAGQLLRLNLSMPLNRLGVLGRVVQGVPNGPPPLLPGDHRRAIKDMVANLGDKVDSNDLPLPSVAAPHSGSDTTACPSPQAGSRTFTWNGCSRPRCAPRLSTARRTAPAPARSTVSLGWIGSARQYAGTPAASYFANDEQRCAGDPLVPEVRGASHDDVRHQLAAVGQPVVVGNAIDRDVRRADGVEQPKQVHQPGRCAPDRGTGSPAGLRR